MEKIGAVEEAGHDYEPSARSTLRTDSMPDGEDLRDPKPRTGDSEPLISMHVLRTERLALVALTPEHARAALEGRANLGRILGARVPETGPGRIADAPITNR